MTKPKSLAKDEQGLTQMRRRFALEYLIDLNATRAAIAAGYSERTASAQGVELLKNPDVQRFVQSALRRREAKVEIDAARVLLELRRMALVDIGDAFDDEGRLLALKDMPEDCRRAIASIETEELFEGNGSDKVRIGRVRKIKLWSKTESAKMLAQHLGLLVERIEIDLGGLDDAQLREALVGILAVASERAKDAAALDVTPADPIPDPSERTGGPLSAAGDPSAEDGS